MDKFLPGFENKQPKNKTLYTKDELVGRLLEIHKRGWITLAQHRQDRDGGLGNTLEDLLGIPENNLPLADYGEFELKTHRKQSNSLISLFRYEPRPGETIPKLIRDYGWPIPKYGPKEKSLRIDIDAAGFCERGFIAQIDTNEKRVELHFDHTHVPKTPEYQKWLESVRELVGLNDLNPIPYWTFDDLERKLQQKIRNMIYISVDVEAEDRKQRMKVAKVQMLRNATLDACLSCLMKGNLQIEFSARTHHNHGTAFRTWERYWPEIYGSTEVLVS